jgi:uncharacterized protein
MEIKPAYFPKAAPIEAYGNGGFRFAEMSHIGSLLCMPSGIYKWNSVTSDSNEWRISCADFEQCLGELESFDVLLVGTGATLKFIPKEVKDFFKARQVVIEQMSTGAAVRTYNVLLAEERRVAAALRAVA